MTGSGRSAGLLEVSAVSNVSSRTPQLGILFISKPSSVLWIQGQTRKLDEACVSPEFSTLVQTIDRSCPLHFSWQPRREGCGEECFPCRQGTEGREAPAVTGGGLDKVVGAPDLNSLLRC